MPALVIAVASIKGGVGKTTLTSCLAVLLGRTGPVLAVDTDVQGNLGDAFGVRCEPARSLGAVLTADSGGVGDPRPAIVHGIAPGVDLLPVHGERLEKAAATIEAMPAKETRLRRALRQVEDDYRFVLIDTPPNFGLFTTNAIVAADAVLGVYEPKPWSMDGVAKVIAHVDRLRAAELSHAQFMGLAANKVDLRRSLDRDILAAITDSDFPCFETVIPERTAIATATGVQQPVVVAAPDSDSAQAMTQLADEIIAAVQASEVLV